MHAEPERTGPSWSDTHPWTDRGWTDRRWTDRGWARRARSIGSGLGLIVLITLSTALTSWLIGRAAQTVAGNREAPWIVGRASGVTAYLLLVGLVGLGLVLSHPWRTRWHRPSTATRIRLHASFGVFTLAFTALHIVVLATDRWAGVGWRGALVPMGASFRPVAVTLGVIGTYAGLLAGITAALAGRLPARLWWPVHKAAGLVLVLIWAHGLLAGSDAATLRPLYLGTGIALLALAVSRYAAATPGDRVERLARDRAQLAAQVHRPAGRALGRLAPRGLQGHGDHRPHNHDDLRRPHGLSEHDDRLRHDGVPRDDQEAAVSAAHQLAGLRAVGDTTRSTR